MKERERGEGRREERGSEGGRLERVYVITLRKGAHFSFSFSMERSERA